MSVNPRLNDNYYRLLEQLQTVDFVLCELNLYLDTHPNDKNALQQYNHLVRERWEIAQMFESQFGPLMNLGHSYSGSPWQWIDSPWPWQV